MENNTINEAGHIHNYSGTEAIQKLKALAEAARTCMFSTFTSKQPLPSRPMALQGVDEAGFLYFFSQVSSDKNRELQANPAVQLFFQNNGSSEYLNVYGTAEISQDRAKIKELWTDWAKAWFQQGADDPELTLITVKPDSVEYWDTKHNKMVQMLKIASSLVTGKTMDDGVEGELNIHK